MQRYVANVAITPSTLRNLGAKDLVRAARQRLAEIDMKPLATIATAAYAQWLDRETQLMMAVFPIRDLWGPARKSLNIFMTMASLNRFLYAAYTLERLETVLEVPLDDIVQKKLQAWGRNRKMFADDEFPLWKSIKALNGEDSCKYQQIALAMAEELGIPRGRLDIALWEPARHG
jgi:hypothetical protein